MSSTATGERSGSLKLCSPEPIRKRTGCANHCKLQGARRTTGPRTAIARRINSGFAAMPSRRQVTTPRAIANTNAISQNSGIAAINTDKSSAVPAARRTDALLVARRTHDRTANGKAIAAITVPSRPAVMAPVTGGRSAYMTAAQMRTGLLAMTPRKVKYAAQPANPKPSNITS